MKKSTYQWVILMLITALTIVLVTLSGKEEQSLQLDWMHGGLLWLFGLGGVVLTGFIPEDEEELKEEKQRVVVILGVPIIFLVIKTILVLAAAFFFFMSTGGPQDETQLFFRAAGWTTSLGIALSLLYLAKTKIGMALKRWFREKSRIG
ncbi:hypothetical protein JXA12_02215 [Candidatus Woesearchaeota archaeon]|nr:hypothetical protein [Candidatus Woesearchaeota archaeon]